MNLRFQVILSHFLCLLFSLPLSLKLGLAFLFCFTDNSLASLFFLTDFSLALSFNGSQSGLVLLLQLGFEDVVGGPNDKVWHLMLEFGVHHSFHALWSGNIGLLVVSLGHIVSRHDLHNCTGFQCVCLLRSADAAAEGEVALARVLRGRWVRDAQRTVDPVAVFGSRSISRVPRVALVAHIVGPEAMEDSDVAAKHAFPVYLRLSVLFTDILASSDLF